MVKNGKRSGKQRYRCLGCGCSFSNKFRPVKLQKILWHKFVWERQTLNQLAKECGRSIKWVQKQLDLASISGAGVQPQKIIAVSDATFWGRGYGILVVRCPKIKKNVHYHEIISETPFEYLKARQELERKGFVIEAAVIDGKRGVANVFKDLPTQLCQFHQIAIVRRYITAKPKLEAGKELKVLARALPIMREREFVELLDYWYDLWQDFLKERTYLEDDIHWHYTHRRIRSAYRSLKNNLPYLFTYQKYPELNIPNTTNSLDGYFNRVKSLLNVHRGLTKERRYKMIQEILRG